MVVVSGSGVPTGRDNGGGEAWQREEARSWVVEIVLAPLQWFYQEFDCAARGLCSGSESGWIATSGSLALRTRTAKGVHEIGNLIVTHDRGRPGFSLSRSQCFIQLFQTNRSYFEEQKSCVHWKGQAMTTWLVVI
jgi:hypothetical protein